MRFQGRNTRAARLTAGQVVEIRQRYAAGESQGMLSRVFEVSLGQIGRIVRGESWQHVPGAAAGRLSERESVDWARRMAGNGLLKSDDEAIKESAARLMERLRGEGVEIPPPPPLEELDPGDGEAGLPPKATD